MRFGDLISTSTMKCLIYEQEGFDLLIRVSTAQQLKKRTLKRFTVPIVPTQNAFPCVIVWVWVWCVLWDDRRRDVLGFLNVGHGSKEQKISELGRHGRFVWK